MTKKQVVNYVLRFIISVALLFYFARNVEFHHFHDVFSRDSLAYLLYAFVLIFINRQITYMRLKMLLEVDGDRIPYLELVKVGWMGDFGTFFMPGLIGGDMLRMFILNKYLRNVAMAVSAVMYERFLGIVSLACVVFVSLFWSDAILNNHPLCISIMSIGCFFIFSLFIFMRFPNYLLRMATFLTRNRGIVGRKIQLLAEALMNFANHKGVFFKVFFLCFLIQINRIIVSYFVARSIGLYVDIQYFFLFTPVIFFLMMIPISVGGFGVREASTVWLFSLVGVTTNQAFIMGLVNSVLIVCYALPGGLFFVMHGFLKKEKESFRNE